MDESNDIDRDLNYEYDLRSNWKKQQSRRSLSAQLNELGIECPAEHSDQEWIQFIFYIVTYSETCNLHAARNLMRSIRQQKEEGK